MCVSERVLELPTSLIDTPGEEEKSPRSRLGCRWLSYVMQCNAMGSFFRCCYYYSHPINQMGPPHTHTAPIDSSIRKRIDEEGSPTKLLACPEGWPEGGFFCRKTKFCRAGRQGFV